MAAEQYKPAEICGCKGIRSCLICEKINGKERAQDSSHSTLHYFKYEPSLRQAIRNEGGVQESFSFPGVFLWEDFVSEEKEKELVKRMDQDCWKESQSGRRKQDFGPKVNFKKQRVRLGGFSGLPASSRDLVMQMRQESLLRGFQPVEQCNLDYDPVRGSAIDPHLDDSWLWGERLVTLSLLSDTVVTMSRSDRLEELQLGNVQGEVQVSVELPRRALIALYGEARHRWKHAIHRRDICQRRVCSTYRELSVEFLPGGQQETLGKQLLDVAQSFQGSPL
ncbi:alpha-ketoglutarate-dependent dioxygenase alkB homolog 4 [Brienomyrus brachyistius]|uniref:alpha-ketoglutarate-dependent dioxygenase alkB homolog 4 n=1 Tax=Brienomyrus brachyistius TaxID=42636 RepID=UPI0020B3ED66|nr:alpha-ketoglutarate-dependent dioxygenase alkB homolog 4 [Brienomyrus brachyistius]